MGDGREKRDINIFNSLVMRCLEKVERKQGDQQVPSVCKADTGDPQLLVQGSLFYYLCSVIVSS